MPQAFVRVRIPKLWWDKFRFSRVSPSQWVTSHIATLLKFEWKDLGFAEYPAYVHRAALRLLIWKKDPFEVHWKPFIWNNPFENLIDVAIRVDAEDHKNAASKLLALRMTWAEFIRCKLEDALLSNAEYERKHNFWRFKYRAWKQHLRDQKPVKNVKRGDLYVPDC